MNRWVTRIGLSAFGIFVGITGILLYQKSPMPRVANSDSPVTVRGGAMTVRTKDAVGWRGANAPFCTGIGLTTSTLYFNYSGLGTASGYSAPPATPIALTGAWSVTIVGRLHNGTDSTQASNNGVVIAPVGTCTGAGTASVYVQLSNTGTYSDFYGPDKALKEEPKATGYTAKRFMDKTPAGTSGTNCQGPSPLPSNPGDEDACERASKVTIQTASGGPYYGWCTNGECVIGLGDITK